MLKGGLKLRVLILKFGSPMTPIAYLRNMKAFDEIILELYQAASGGIKSDQIIRSLDITILAMLSPHFDETVWLHS